MSAAGPAGENRGPMCVLVSEATAAGRGRTGAVLGAKNLKAITVRGTKDIQVADMKGWRSMDRPREKFLALDNLVRLGTPFLVDMINKAGGLGSRNWQEETWKGAEKIRAERLLEDHFVRNWVASPATWAGAPAWCAPAPTLPCSQKDRIRDPLRPGLKLRH